MPIMDRPFDAVLFDWRGTLVTTPTHTEWVAEALRRIGRPAEEGEVDELAALVAGAQPLLDGPGVDCDADLHRRTYLTTFAELGIEPQLATGLYAVESDPSVNVFAADVAGTLSRLHSAGLRIAVISDIHVDIRPHFAASGLDGLVDVFTLSFEQGVQKPDPQMFTRTLAAVDVDAHRTLMVGDRSRPDGAAVEAGVPTLLLPPLTRADERRLHLVLALTGAEVSALD
jgi:FMN phosphatase YigB (HAD superfamily)